MEWFWLIPLPNNKHRTNYRIDSGSWSSDGVETVSATLRGGVMTVECQSSHLSSFAVLVDVSGTLRDVWIAVVALSPQVYTTCSPFDLIRLCL